MILLKHLLINEALDSPYKCRHTFTTEEIDEEDEETGETYKKDVLTPVQMIKFKTAAGIDYMWYARQSRYDPTCWNIAFGVHEGIEPDGTNKLNIDITKTGDAFRIFATVIEITNSFVEFDSDNYEIVRMMMTAKEDNRANLYVKRFVPLIENFKLEHVERFHGETQITLVRTN
jgi:hypothetical protein